MYQDGRVAQGVRAQVHVRVDNDELWKYIVKVVTTATAKGKAITRMQQRDFAMILFKTAAGCRSSDMNGWGPRDSQYCTLYDDKDVEVTSFDKAAKMQIRFKNPKDPHCLVHKNERWSYVFVVHRIRYAMLIDPECEWLKTTECVQALDLFWHLHRYTTRFSNCLVQPAHAAQDNAHGLLIHGRFWMNVVQSALPGADGFTRPQPIYRSRLLSARRKCTRWQATPRKSWMTVVPVPPAALNYTVAKTSLAT